MAGNKVSRRDFIASTSAFLVGGCLGHGPAKENDIAWRPGHYQVHYIYTGRGESMFHIFPDGTSMLLDVGDSMRFYKTPKELPMLPDLTRRAGEWTARYVKRVNPKGNKVDFVHVSHYHEDHCGGVRYHGGTVKAPTGEYCLSGLADASRFLEFGCIVDRASPGFDEPYDSLKQSRDGTARNLKALCAALKEKGTRVERFRLGARDQFRQLDKAGAYPGFEVFNLCSNGKFVMKDGSVRDLLEHQIASGDAKFSENVMSCGIVVKYGKFRYFSAGDFSGRVKGPRGRMIRVENALAEALDPVDVAKINHHGYRSMYEDLVRALKARVWTCCMVDEAHCSIDTMNRICDRTLYPGPRTVLPTYMPQRGRSAEDCAKYLPDVAPAVLKEPCHVILDVPEGGQTYSFTCVSATSEEPRITAHMEFAAS